MRSLKAMTGIQEAVYVTYRFDCKERNALGYLLWSIRRNEGHLFDLRDIRDKIRCRRIELQRREIRTQMVIDRLAAKPKQTRKLMAVAR